MSTYSIFCIGTGHTQVESNNTIAALGHACSGMKTLNDGPTGGAGLAIGWGMNTALKKTMDDLTRSFRRPGVTRVVMTGHSRGAILCHMIAHAIFKSNELKALPISMYLIDPVHQSILNHSGAERLDQNPKLEKYRAIMMMNENAAMGLQKLNVGRVYPFKFVKADDQIRDRMRYIPMPGTHGSGTQQLTSPVGRLTASLIANFMRKRGTDFLGRWGYPTSHPDICELFAEIHRLNPLTEKARRVVFDDGGQNIVHVEPGRTQSQGFAARAGSVQRAMAFNEQHHAKGLQNQALANLCQSYFFNEEHAHHFSKAFPACHAVLCEAPRRASRPLWELATYEVMNRMGSPGLAYARPVLLMQMLPLAPL